MAKVEIVEKPSDEVINRANQEFSVTDARGRQIKIKKPNALAQLRLVKAVGDSAKNEIWLNMIMPILYVKELDGISVAPPLTEREAEAIFERLDDEGIMAVVNGIQNHFGNNATSLEEAKEAIKK